MNIHSSIINLIPDSTPDKNGRVYSRKSLDEAIDEFNSRVPVLCELIIPTIKNSMQFIDECTRLDRVSHSVIGIAYKHKPNENTRTSEISGIEVSFQVLDTPMGCILSQLLSESKPKMSYSMIGCVDENSIVTDIKFVSFGLVE